MKFVASQKVCNGNGVWKGYVKSTAACAELCKDKKHFIVGTNMNGKYQCGGGDDGSSCCKDNGSCKCWCQPDPCNQRQHAGYNLYEINPGN